MATRSPRPSPRPRSAPASRRHRSHISACVSAMSPQATAGRSPATCAARCRGPIIVVTADILPARARVRTLLGAPYGVAILHPRAAARRAREPPADDRPRRRRWQRAASGGGVRRGDREPVRAVVERLVGVRLAGLGPAYPVPAHVRVAADLGVQGLHEVLVLHR